MQDLIEIIATAKTKESWCVSGKYNYGPIDYLQDKVMYADGEWKENFANFDKHVHEVTDARTYMVWLFKNYDIYVDCTRIASDMLRAFPEIETKQVWQWLQEEKEPHHIFCA